MGFYTIVDILVSSCVNGLNDLCLATTIYIYMWESKGKKKLDMYVLFFSMRSCWVHTLFSVHVLVQKCDHILLNRSKEVEKKKFLYEQPDTILTENIAYVEKCLYGLGFKVTQATCRYKILFKLLFSLICVSISKSRTLFHTENLWGFFFLSLSLSAKSKLSCLLKIRRLLCLICYEKRCLIQNLTRKIKRRHVNNSRK